MHEFVSLLKVQFKNTYGPLEVKGKRSFFRKYAFVFVLIALLPTLVSFTFLTRDALKLLLPLQQEGIILGLLMAVVSTLIFFFGIFLIPSIFYFSKDIETLLALPLKPENIVLSKFLVALAFEYLTVLFITVPILIGYGSMVMPSLGFYVFLVFVLLLIPIVPLVLSSIIVMLVMRFLPFAKNKDFFNYLSGFLMLGFAVGINLTTTQLVSSLSQADVLRLLQEGNNSLMNLYSYAMPTLPYAVNSLVRLSVLDLVIMALITLIVLVVFVGLARVWYFKGAIGINETGANRKKLSDKAYAHSTLLHHPVWTYTLKELRLMIRTPIYFLNNVATALFMPIIFGGMLFTNLNKDPDIQMLLDSIPWGHPSLPVWILGGGLAIGFFMGSVNLITPTAISREGTNAWFMKIIPMSYKQQLIAKILSGLIISLLGSLAFVIPFAIFFHLSLLNLFHATLGILLATLSMNVWGMVVDVYHPKLIWEQEAVPVKQNINAAFTMLPGFGLPALIFMGLANTPLHLVEAFGYPVLVLLGLILNGIILLLFLKTSSKGMAKLEI